MHISNGLHGSTKRQRALYMRERLLSAAASRDDNVSVAEDSAHQALVDGDGLDLVEHQLDGACTEHSNFHHDALIGHSEIRTLSFDIRREQNQKGEGEGYPDVLGPIVMNKQPGDRQ